MLEDLIGIPYLRNGRDKSGFDCYGLVKEIYHRIGKDLPEFQSPDDNCLLSSVINEYKPSCTILLHEPEPYCLVAFCVEGPYVTHMGVVLDDCKRFIHVLENRNVCIERLDHRFWVHRNRGYFKWNFN